ncbi:MAG: cytochrome c5 family protein [Gammaproteobacteria bacterium]|nr:cytochrome c5 family protein [Gammaproteobacteria bacterium]
MSSQHKITAGQYKQPALAGWSAVILTVLTLTFYGPAVKALSEAELKAVEERIRPIGQVYLKKEEEPKPEAPAAQKTAEKAEETAPAPDTATVAAANAAPPASRSGEDIYKALCFACHFTGAAGAPKLGNKAEWGPRVEKGHDALAGSVINGLNAMPPRAGNPLLSDEEIKAAVNYMLEQLGDDMPGMPPKPELTAKAPSQAAAPSAAAPGGNGEQTYKAACFACHMTGAANAPKLGDKAAWAPRIAQGIEVLREHSIKGYKGMPPKGGRIDLSDQSVLAAVAYMVLKSQ